VRGLSLILGTYKFDGLVTSLNNMSFRAKREILPMEHAENTRVLPAVEMTDSPDTTFYEVIKFSFPILTEAHSLIQACSILDVEYVAPFSSFFVLVKDI